MIPIPELLALQRNGSNVRNLCVVAHVDHGKTTLTDTLICTNGIFSQRNAGHIRYMDFTAEEQRRRITMKSASISLLYRKPKDDKKYLINLIDSPGHVDFTSEVSSALRLTDGCIVVVDAVEGVCIQTRVVLRQAWAERVKPVLFVNKIDKLYTKLEMDEETAFVHIKKILTLVNEITSVLWLEELGSRDQTTPVSSEQAEAAKRDLDDPYTDLDLDADDGEYFSPSKGNVVFGSALGGWGFRLENFVSQYEKKLGIRPDVLLKTLWGDYFFSPKKKMIYKKPPEGSGKAVPMFVNFIMKPLWAVYGAFFP